MKDRRLEMRLSEREYERLYALAAADPDCLMRRSGKPSLSAYIRKHIIWSGEDPHDMKRELRSLTYQVRKAGVNINQAVRRINAGLFDGREVEEILASQKRMEGLLFQICNLVREETCADNPAGQVGPDKGGEADGDH